MRHRLGLAAALLGDPRVLVLDEPANGLDPQGIRWLRDFLRSLAAEGRAVLVSSDVLAEVAQTADEVVVIHRGRSVAQAPLAQLMAQRNGGVRVAGPDVGGLADRLRGDGAAVTPEATGAIVVHDRSGEDVGRAVAAGAFVISELVPLGSSLEEIFLASGEFERSIPAARQALAAAGIVQIAAGIFGILAVTGEFRYGTITPTLLVTPDRRRLVLAKLIALLLAGLALGLLSFGIGAAIALSTLSSRDIASGLEGGEVLAIVAGGTAGTGLFAAVGVGVGALLRNQVGAIVATLAWLYALEPLLGLVPGLGDAIERYGFAALSSGLSDTAAADPNADLLVQLPAGLLLAAYAGILLAAGTALLRRRDIA